MPARLLSIIKFLLILAIAATFAYLLVAHRELFQNPRQIKSEILSWGAWGPVAYMALYAFGPSLLVPGAVMTIAAGLAFGTVKGAIYAVAGADVGALVAFGAGRFLGRDFVASLVGDRFRGALDRIARNGFHIILYLRIFPLIPYNALNLLAGASPIRFTDYFWASVIGMIPGTILFAFLGNELWHPTSPRFMLALFLILLCFAGGEFYRRRRLASAEPNL
jgi:uncharacterized membrane protein YdjX (TVP38/TMEM64 family)